MKAVRLGGGEILCGGKTQMMGHDDGGWKGDNEQEAVRGHSIYLYTLPQIWNLTCGMMFEYRYAVLGVNFH